MPIDIAQQYPQNTLLRFHCNNGYAKLRNSQLIWFFHPKVQERSQVPILSQVNGKAKVHPITGHEGAERE
jgi:hypothetical protein